MINLWYYRWKGRALDISFEVPRAKKLKKKKKDSHYFGPILTGLFGKGLSLAKPFVNPFY